jgi:P-type Cu+ transporter
MSSASGQKACCAHCGDPLGRNAIISSGLAFCCNGCETVYRILHTPEGCTIVRPQPVDEHRFAFLDEPSIVAKLRSFSDGLTSAVRFTVPQMHCSSCVWLLENLYRMEPAILASRVDFVRRSVFIRYAERETTLRKVVELLAGLGYEPQITLGSPVQKESNADYSLYYRVGIAGFCFGNIMILKFPDYLSGGSVDPVLRTTFALLIFLLSLPIVFYCAGIYFRFAAGGLRKGVITLDVPIALGVAVLFIRSLADLLTTSGSGYFDSLAGLVFFLLIGRLFQEKTYDALNFERTYESYFPLAVSTLKQGVERSVPVGEIRPGDRMIIRNNEIIPMDAVVIDGTPEIDYSFVTGESRRVRCERGALLYAGGRQIGSAIVLEAVAACSQSYLTQLWNGNALGSDGAGRLVSISNTFSKYFTVAVLLIACATGIYWYLVDAPRVLETVVAVLIVACPCALALSVPFAFGTAQRLLGQSRLYLKNIAVVEQLAHITDIVLDKTGTITQAHGGSVRFTGTPLSERERQLVATLAHNSYHPLSRSVSAALKTTEYMRTSEFVERANLGIEGVVDGVQIRLGSPVFTGSSAEPAGSDDHASRVYLAIDGAPRGYFSVAGTFRERMGHLIRALRRKYTVTILSGDTDWQRSSLDAEFGSDVSLHFSRTPDAKRRFVEDLQSQGRSVLMVGDGLNDGVALRAASVGIAVTDDVAAFTPASDAILEGGQLAHLDNFLTFARRSKNVVVLSYGISVLYNVVGLAFAVSGTLSPLVAALLMPLSSITVVAFTTITVRVAGRTLGVTA